jgi:hypothetical protein
LEQIRADGAPPRAKIVAGNRLVFSRTGTVRIGPRDDVVKAGVVVGTFSNRVKGRIGEANGWLPIGGGLLIHERHKTGPQRSCQAGTALWKVKRLGNEIGAPHNI